MDYRTIHLWTSRGLKTNRPSEKGLLQLNYPSDFISVASAFSFRKNAKALGTLDRFYNQISMLINNVYGASNDDINAIRDDDIFTKGLISK